MALREEHPPAEMAVMFHRADRPSERATVFTLTEAAALSYHVSMSDSRLTLRCPYSSPLSYITKVKGVDLEIVSATMLYRLQSNFLAVDTTMRRQQIGQTCLSFSPLVHGQFQDRGVRVNGRALSESDAKERRYKIGLKEGRVESGVVRGQYVQHMSVDLFCMRQWEDERWPLKQLRS